MTVIPSGTSTHGIPLSDGGTFTPESPLLYGYFPFIGAQGTAAPLSAGLPAFSLVALNASGQIVPCVATASDGTQNPVGVTTIPLLTNKAAQPVSFWRTGGFNFKRLNVDASWKSADALNLALTKLHAPMFVGTNDIQADPNAVKPVVADTSALV